MTKIITCDVCWILDGDARPKACTWCSRCNAWICDDDQSNWIRRTRAAAIRARLIARAVAVVALAIAAVLSFARPAAAQGPAYPYSVSLSCTPPSSGTPSGYNFYRATFSSSACGNYARLNSTPVSGCAYVDSSPPNGLYCYEVTDLDANNDESAPDQMAGHVAIPLPPPTGLGATVARNTNGTYDVIYAWKNPTPAPSDNTIYCGPTKASAPIVKTFFPTTKVRITSPPGAEVCGVTDTDAAGAESGLSNLAKVTVP